MDHKPNTETILNSKIYVQSKSLHPCLRIPEWVAMPSSMGLPDPEIKPKSLMSPHWEVVSLPIVPGGKAKILNPK